MEGTIHIFGKDIKKTTFYGGLAVALLGIAAFFYFRARAAAGGTGAAAPQAAADQGGGGGGGIAVGVPNQAQADAYNKALQDLKDAAAGFNQRQQANQSLQQQQQQQLQQRVQVGPVVAGGYYPGIPQSVSNIPAVYQPTTGQCAPGESQAILPDGRVLCGGNFGPASAPAGPAYTPPPQPAQQPQQDTHAAPPGTQCPPGQHWSYNQRQCRGNVNWATTAVNGIAAFFTGGATAPQATQSAANNLGYDPGISGGGGGNVSQQPYYNPSAGGSAEGGYRPWEILSGQTVP